MRLHTAVICLFFAAVTLQAQSIYFPPIIGSSWETITPTSLGWNTSYTDTLYTFLQNKNSKAFIVLKDGRIVLEKYFGTFSRDSVWMWASAGKTLTSFMVGIAQHEGLLKLSDTTSKIIGAGWTSEPSDKERKITVRHQLTMSSGLKDNVPDPYCTLPECLLYQADAGSRWAYHNAPYTLLDSVIIKSTGQTFSGYFNAKIRNRIGIVGTWIKSGYNNVFFSTPRGMARFGILLQAKGIWATDTLMKDRDYFNAMINTSQNINKSYGYLFWLNGKESHMLPQSQFVFPGWVAPDAPGDMYAAMGKNGQFINVAPSLGIVLIRMGEAPDSSFEVPTKFNNDIWVHFNKVINRTTSVSSSELRKNAVITAIVQPMPASEQSSLIINSPEQRMCTLSIVNSLGEQIYRPENISLQEGETRIPFSKFSIKTSGVYFYHILSEGSSLSGKFIFTE